jgi:protein phosphatase
MTAAEAERSPERNVITRALGLEPSIAPLIWRKGFPLRLGDAFVLCSDGLSDLVPAEAIGDMVGRLPPFEACRALVEAALSAGGGDNVSVGVFAVGESPPAAPAPRATRPIQLPADMP